MAVEVGELTRDEMNERWRWGVQSLGEGVVALSLMDELDSVATLRSATEVVEYAQNAGVHDATFLVKAYRVAIHGTPER